MPRKIVAFVLLAVALASLFVRLGVWQLQRLDERRVYNAALAAQLAQPPVPFDRLGPEDRARRAVVEGTPDWEHEFVQTGRSLNGSPGVYILTPVRPPEGPAVLVNRGWVYAPDAATVDLAAWRESRTRFTGHTALPQPGTSPSVPTRTAGRSTRVLTPESIAALVPYPVAPLYLVARDSGGPGIPARLPEIELSNGPHLSYAIQWFSFAAIALVGAALVAVRARRPSTAGSTAA